MHELCKTCKSRSYCYLINLRFFQSLGMLMNFDNCPLYVSENGKIQSEDQQISVAEHCNTPDASVSEKEFEVTVELSIHGKVTEFELNGIKPGNCSMLKRFNYSIFQSFGIIWSMQAHDLFISRNSQHRDT